ncbi:MAG: 23S rRNA (adenine(2503)-C(2))-methyltransferase RlmN [Pseudanabaenaceae cyanobacterium SKYGB_i_bin29]|nr:23S rRNA (adenine(2503)-C(2))-methyltransferase RlmN [Pseudanabaenaceae cyanobacterium SKYG29]MDW8422626.1 23S rRNA (adenine(2503)-C(2))-methyltransferase RlmN [Pseudanabaenaceae cyanobacterium SKYGB_i_bin29]
MTTLLGKSRSELMDWAVQMGQPAFRGKQVHEWIYSKGVSQLGEIPVLPKQWREALRDVKVGRSQVVHRVRAKDSTEKFLLQLEDGKLIETVGIPTSKRLTVCVSTQVGCPMGCTFCATGKGGWQRNLREHEIIDQVLTVQQQMQRRVSHLVFMGMGEPLLNLENLVGAIYSLHQDVGISQRHMTISTVGIPQKIAQLATYDLQATLAVSLHAPTQELRRRLVPAADRYPLDRLLADCQDYVAKTGRRVSFEYTLLAGVNDSIECAMFLAKLVRGFQSHVNLIPYNPIGIADFQRPREKAIAQFQQTLEREGVAVSVRRTRGLEADAACGQLRGRYGEFREN